MFPRILFSLLFAVILKSVFSIETTKELEGLPSGYLTDCPGVKKEARISKSSLWKLQLIHFQKGHFLTANRTFYRYHQMKTLAKNLDFSKKTIVFQSGYMDSSNYNILAPAIGGLYASFDYNVLLVEYAHFMYYEFPIAARLLRPVGQKVAEMLAELTKQGLDPKKVELLGISHGGQGISFIGKSYKRITGIALSRITGLDPSGPCFRRLGPEDRIDASDADKVDLIHTNNDAFGFTGAVGHVNFYVNGGDNQLFDMAFFLPCDSFCSHIRSIILWIAAMLHPDLFVAVKCNSIQDARDKNCSSGPLVTNLMGPKTDFNRTGIFKLMTTNVYPFGVGEKGIRQGFDQELNLISKVNEVDEVVV